MTHGMKFHHWRIIEIVYSRWSEKEENGITISMMLLHSTILFKQNFVWHKISKTIDFFIYTLNNGKIAIESYCPSSCCCCYCFGFFMLSLKSLSIFILSFALTRALTAKCIHNSLAALLCSVKHTHTHTHTP